MTSAVTLDTRQLPARDRFAWWCEITARDLLPTRITTEHTADFRARASHLQLGEVTVSALELPPLRSARTPALIRRADPELWELALVSTGSLWIEQDRDGHLLTPGDLVLYDTSRPFDSRVVGAGRPARAVILHLPRRLLPLPDGPVRSLAARPLPARDGAGALLAGYLTGLADQAVALDDGDHGRLGRPAVDLAAAFLAGLSRQPDGLSPTGRAEVLRREVIAFILRRLGEPDLSPSTVAAAHHISVRSLYLLFAQGGGPGPGRFIRDERLRRCRADLLDPLLAGHTVAELGARWGFTDPGAFNRAFRRAHGIPPGEFRRQARQGHGRAPRER